MCSEVRTYKYAHSTTVPAIQPKYTPQHKYSLVLLPSIAHRLFHPHKNIDDPSTISTEQKKDLQYSNIKSVKNHQSPNPLQKNQDRSRKRWLVYVAIVLYTPAHPSFSSKNCHYDMTAPPPSQHSSYRSRTHTPHTHHTQRISLR